MTTLYIVGIIQKQIEAVTSVPIPCLSKTVTLAWSDGQVGACPVFERFEDAERYADGAAIIPVTVTPAFSSKSEAASAVRKARGER